MYVSHVPHCPGCNNPNRLFFPMSLDYKTCLSPSNLSYPSCIMTIDLSRDSTIQSPHNSITPATDLNRELCRWFFRFSPALRSSIQTYPDHPLPLVQLPGLSRSAWSPTLNPFCSAWLQLRKRRSKAEKRHCCMCRLCSNLSHRFWPFLPAASS